MKTWIAKCRKCSAPVYYYDELEINIRFDTMHTVNKDIGLTRAIKVDCACTGDNETGTKHTERYEFPKDFTED